MNRCDECNAPIGSEDGAFCPACVWIAYERDAVNEQRNAEWWQDGPEPEVTC